jgi:hypothetical protein
MIRIDRLMPDVAMLHLDDAKIDFSEVSLGSFGASYMHAHMTVACLLACLSTGI